ncbi:3-oxoacyl-(Acyl carrier protein) synthase II [Candidatus Terasakiella magnetica]|nr:3-oxoacyl-(Acyl carrier protein) synthase II [Candidatus Terasakiella magnetica]
MRRVVVTGMGGVTALGNDWPTIRGQMSQGRTGIRRMEAWERFEGVNTRLGAPVLDFALDERWPRKKTRTMGPVARFAVFATERALENAGLLDHPVLGSGRAGVAYGSSFGSPDSVLGFYELKMNGVSKALNATTYIQMMGHTTAVNIGLFFGLTGRVITTSSSCTSGSQGIGYAAEAIRAGKADIMVAGGAEELDITDAAVFDTLFATSTRNDSPHLTPQPYDRDRDGLVIGEGAATLVLEEYEHAKARGARIHAELVGFGTNSDGNHVTQPQPSTMEVALRLALEDAALKPEAIGLVSGHGTATEGGDIAETQATAAVFGPGMPIHSLKSYFGHSLGACGSIEAWLGIEMMKEGWFCPTANLVDVDERCGRLDYIKGSARRMRIEHFMTNNFAFGGINTSLIFKRI